MSVWNAVFAETERPSIILTVWYNISIHHISQAPDRNSLSDIRLMPWIASLISGLFNQNHGSLIISYYLSHASTNSDNFSLYFSKSNGYEMASPKEELELSLLLWSDYSYAGVSQYLWSRPLVILEILIMKLFEPVGLSLYRLPWDKECWCREGGSMWRLSKSSCVCIWSPQISRSRYIHGATQSVLFEVGLYCGRWSSYVGITVSFHACGRWSLLWFLYLGMLVVLYAGIVSIPRVCLYMVLYVGIVSIPGYACVVLYAGIGSVPVVDGGCCVVHTWVCVRYIGGLVLFRIWIVGIVACLKGASALWQHWNSVLSGHKKWVASSQGIDSFMWCHNIVASCDVIINSFMWCHN